MAVAILCILFGRTETYLDICFALLSRINEYHQVVIIMNSVSNAELGNPIAVSSPSDWSIEGMLYVCTGCILDEEQAARGHVLRQ